VSDWKDRLVLVTGATGFIGSHLAERLVVEGARVRVLVRNPQKLIPSLINRVEVARGDLLRALPPLCAGVRSCFMWRPGWAHRHREKQLTRST